MNENIPRRTMLKSSATGALALATDAATAAPPTDQGQSKAFGLCLNTATLGRDRLTLPQQIDIAAGAGYNGIEPWIAGLQAFADGGGSLEELRKRTEDLGLTVESAIGFAPWSVDDDARRVQGLEQMRRDMDLIKQLGGKRIAAPPAGAYSTPISDLNALAVRYRAVLEIGKEIGVLPQLEIWGSSKTLSRLEEAVHVAIATQDPDACLLLDVFHLYRGGSDFQGLGLLNGAAMHVFHMNDYPATPPRGSIGDQDRVYPGDGVAPLSQILGTLHQTGFRGMLSLEIFNPNYWKQDPLEIARIGIKKTRLAVQKALA